MMRHKRLGDIMVTTGEITKEQLSIALAEQKVRGLKLGETLVQLGYITAPTLYNVLEMQYGIPYFDIETAIIDPKIPKLIPETMARNSVIIPVKFENNELYVAMADPLDFIVQDDLKIATNLNIKPMISQRAHILKALDRYYDNSEQAQAALGEYVSQAGYDSKEEKGEDIEVLSSPMVKFVNSLISQAIKSRASDIHIEPFEDIVRIRIRVDGILREIMTTAKATQSALTARIKIISGMNIAERRIPQDGRVETEIDGKHVDMRVSSLPTVYGEKIVIRILDRSSILLTRAQLGFSEANSVRFENLLKVPEGIILVTGPTGSGKSTTLYNVLRGFNKPEVNLITVEDPVEYRVEGINQVQTNAKAGLTFASALRSILRQDPDIVMVGEIRDAETAEIAIRASITGHIVLSTLHTNDAASTLLRLVDMGIEPYLVSTAVKGIVAQRLVRKLCVHCKAPYVPSEAERQLLKIGDDEDVKIYKPIGCNTCSGIGYSGRTGIHEILLVNDEIQSMMNKGAEASQIQKVARDHGMLTLQDSCVELVKKGVTTIDEVLRVTFKIDEAE